MPNWPKDWPKANHASYGAGNCSPPEVIANTISRALKAKRPQTRYAVGKYAKPMIGLRKWFGDRVFERALMSRY